MHLRNHCSFDQKTLAYARNYRAATVRERYATPNFSPLLTVPLFFLAPALGPHPEAFLKELAGDDARFFLPGATDESRDGNYNDNTALVQAIGDGARGAWWDILRRMRAG